MHRRHPTVDAHNCFGNLTDDGRSRERYIEGGREGGREGILGDAFHMRNSHGTIISTASETQDENYKRNYPSKRQSWLFLLRIDLPESIESCHITEGLRMDRKRMRRQLQFSEARYPVTT